MNATSHPAVLAVAAAVAHAANILRVPIDQIVVDYVEARDWRDSCLELPNDNEACNDVVTPGYLIVLGDGFRYRADHQGNVRREPEPVDTEVRVYFKQAGGLEAGSRSTSPIPPRSRQQTTNNCVSSSRIATSFTYRRRWATALHSPMGIASRSFWPSDDAITPFRPTRELVPQTARHSGN